jgi:large subunit ribosomal protein L25
VECLPANIPEHLDVDVTELHLNQHVSVSDLRVAEGVRIMDEPSQIIAGVATPRAEEVPAEAAADEAAAAEPQVEKKGGEAAADKDMEKA